MFDLNIIRDDVPLHVRADQGSDAVLTDHSKLLRPLAKHHAVGDYFALHIQPEAVANLSLLEGTQFVGKLALQKVRRIFVCDKEMRRGCVLVKTFGRIHGISRRPPQRSFNAHPVLLKI